MKATGHEMLTIIGMVYGGLVAESREGVPSGHLYAHGMSFGCDLTDHEIIVNSLVSLGDFRKEPSHLVVFVGSDEKRRVWVSGKDRVLAVLNRALDERQKKAPGGEPGAGSDGKV